MKGFCFFLISLECFFISCSIFVACCKLFRFLLLKSPRNFKSCIIICRWWRSTVIALWNCIHIQWRNAHRTISATIRWLPWGSGNGFMPRIDGLFFELISSRVCRENVTAMIFKKHTDLCCQMHISASHVLFWSRRPCCASLSYSVNVAVNLG